MKNVVLGFICFIIIHMGASSKVFAQTTPSSEGFKCGFGIVGNIAGYGSTIFIAREASCRANGFTWSLEVASGRCKDGDGNILNSFCSNVNICPSGDDFIEADAEGFCPDPIDYNKDKGCDEENITDNPCNVATGNKFRSERDFTENSLSFTRYYNSQLLTDIGIGVGWRHSYQKSLIVSDDSLTQVSAAGRGEPWVKVAGIWLGDADSDVIITETASGFELTKADGAKENYDLFGQLVFELDTNGHLTRYNNDASGKLVLVSNHYGHTLEFIYDGSLLESVTDSSGSEYRYEYDDNQNLVAVIFPDETPDNVTDNPRKTYHYEDTNYKNHLTGITDENGDRFGTYNYDSNGKVVSSERGITSNTVGQGRIDLTYSLDSTTVTDAVGTEEVWVFEDVLGSSKLIERVNQEDNKGLSRTWDENGNLLTHTDEEGRTTTYAYNSDNQRVSMTEASGADVSRTTTYEYVSEDIDLVTKKVSPSIFEANTKEVITSYDANQNIKQVVINGFDAAGNAVVRTTTFDHDVYGKVIEIDGPRTDLNDITVMEYYDCDTGAECGQLRKITNTLEHETNYDAYDGAARLLQSTDSNGVITTYTYHPRGWMLSMTSTPPSGEARIRTWDYDSAGQIKKTTMPDGTEQNYVYDAAHALREISDNLGNKISYIYDAKGNLTTESVFDPDGTLVLNTQTSYGIRNFVTSVYAGDYSLTEMINDAVGNLLSNTDPNLNPSTTHTFDALNRLTETIDGITNSTTYEYDVADQLQQVTSPNGSQTQYEYDDLVNQTKEISADRGTVVRIFDNAGNITRVTDDRGIVREYAFDALNRLVGINYPDSAENITHSYDVDSDGRNCGARIGRLCKTVDESGDTYFQYDVWGNIVRQEKIELGVTYVTSYVYDAADRVVEMTYPDGRIVSYSRDQIGRVSGVSTTRLGETVDVISNRTYRGDHLPTGQIYGNGLQEERSYDLQGWIRSIQLGDVVNWSYLIDPNGNVEQIQKPQATYIYQHDALDRLTSEADGLPPVSIQSVEEFEDGSVFEDEFESFIEVEAAVEDITTINYFLDANGNRIGKDNRVLEYQANSNLLVKDGNVDIFHDEIGNTLNLRGDRTFTYSNSGRLRTASRDGVLKATYRYNSSNQRTRKEIPDKNTQVFHYDIRGNLILRTRNDGKPIEDYIWLDRELIQYTRIKGVVVDGSIEAIKAKTYVTTDHLGTPRIGTDDAQIKTWEWVADAFNKSRPDRNPDGDEFNVNLKIGFPGQYYDAESGLYYNWNRYYDRKIGRYVTSDPIGLEGGINTFVYVLGNPLRYFDPDGLKTCGSGANEPFVPDNPLGYKFSSCCETHDKCYETCKSGQKNCDNAFHKCMLDKCKGKSGLCKWAAKRYYKAVKKHGKPAYDAAQEKACKGCEKED